MLLSLREAAILLGRSPRTLRAQVARGEVKGVKQNNRWMIARAALPMSDSRLAEVQRRAEQVRAEVEAALPSRTGARKPRSIEDFAPFRVVREVLASLPPGSPAAPALRRAALALAAGVHRYRGPDKHAALAAARDALAEGAAELLLHPLPDLAAARRLEEDALGRLGGLLRWAERAA
jgi:hypothetical protein